MNTKRTLLFVGIVLSLSLMLSACGGENPTVGVVDFVPAEAPAEAPANEAPVVSPDDPAVLAVAEKIAQTQVLEYLGNHDTNKYCVAAGATGQKCIDLLLTLAEDPQGYAGAGGDDVAPVSETSPAVIYNPQERPVYTAGEDPKGNEIRARFESIFEPLVAREVRVAPERGAVTFNTDKVVLGDVLVNGVPVFRDAGKEAEVTVLPAGFSLECPWWCSVYETTDLRPADALAREFLAGCTDQDGVGCQSVAWHWFEGAERKDAQFASLEALFVTPCSFWVGKRMPAGASCLVEAGYTATVGGEDPFVTVYDLNYTWAYSADGQRDFVGHAYLYNPAEFSVVAYK